MQSKDIKTKIVLLGDSSVGKSSILRRLKFNSFDNTMESTIGCDFFAKEFTVKNNIKVKLLIWDTAGQEVFRSFTPNFLRGATIIVIVYSVALKQSFDNINSWIKEVENVPNSSIVIVGSKSDLENKIDQTELLNLRQINNVSIFGTVSAKNNTNIQELFIHICEQYLHNKHIKTTNEHSDTEVINLREKKQTRTCCI